MIGALLFAIGETDCDSFKVPLLKALLAELRQNDAIRLDRILPALPALEDPHFIESFRAYSSSPAWTQFIKKQVGTVLYISYYVQYSCSSLQY